jgi:hypothetical protein
MVANKGITVARVPKIGVLDLARKPGTWAELPKAKADWDSPKTNTAIAKELTGEYSFSQS